MIFLAFLYWIAHAQERLSFAQLHSLGRSSARHQRGYDGMWQDSYSKRSVDPCMADKASFQVATKSVASSVEEPPDRGCDVLAILDQNQKHQDLHA